MIAAVTTRRVNAIPNTGEYATSDCDIHLDAEVCIHDTRRNIGGCTDRLGDEPPSARTRPPAGNGLNAHAINSWREVTGS